MASDTRGHCVPPEEQHVALPKLYGAPQYARPPVVAVVEQPRPFDPDEMPIDAFQTADERDLAESLPARAYAAGGGMFLDDQMRHRLRAIGRRFPRPRPFLLRALIFRVLGRQV
jgi:hypothetical protein